MSFSNFLMFLITLYDDIKHNTDFDLSSIKQIKKQDSDWIDYTMQIKDVFTDNSDIQKLIILDELDYFTTPSDTDSLFYL